MLKIMLNLSLGALLFQSPFLWAQEGLNRTIVTPETNTAVAQFLNTDEDKIAYRVMEKLDASERPEMILESLKATEDLLLQNGWTICEGPVVPSSITPFGFQFFSKIRLCFYSVSENTGLWLANFIRDSVRGQSLFYTAVERLRRSIARENSSRAVVRQAKRS